LEHCEVRHLSNSYLATTIVDSQKLFQFNNPDLPQNNSDSILRFENTIYSDDLEFVGKARNQLIDVWKNCQVTTAVTLETITNSNLRGNGSQLGNPAARSSKKLNGHFVIENEEETKKMGEQDILDKIIHSEKRPINCDGKQVIRTYGANAQTIVRPPGYLNLPEMLFFIYHMEKDSTFGAEDAIQINLPIETGTGSSFIPVALITDNPDSVYFWRKSLAGLPAENSVQLIKKDELKIRIYGNNLFAGWTVKIPLLNHYILPPSCLLIEGHGNIMTHSHTVMIPSGYKLYSEFNCFEAFVTFLHPLSKYSGPGTDGYFARDTIMEFYPP
jgi:hypothetical protein